MWYKFWLKSGRGTDEQTYRWLEYDEKPANPDGLTRAEKQAEIKTELEQWCSHFACWEMGESVMDYGFKTVKLPPVEFLEIQLKDAKSELRDAQKMIRLLAKQVALARRPKKKSKKPGRRHGGTDFYESQGGTEYDVPINDPRAGDPND